MSYDEAEMERMQQRILEEEPEMQAYMEARARMKLAMSQRAAVVLELLAPLQFPAMTTTVNPVQMFKRTCTLPGCGKGCDKHYCCAEHAKEHRERDRERRKQEAKALTIVHTMTLEPPTPPPPVEKPKLRMRCLNCHFHAFLSYRNKHGQQRLNCRRCGQVHTITKEHKLKMVRV